MNNHPHPQATDVTDLVVNRNRVADAIQCWWLTQRHEVLLRDYAVDLARAAIEASTQDAGIERYVAALTPSGVTKAAYIGEFSFPITLNEGTDDEEVLRTYVPWDTIKDIMAAIRRQALAIGEKA